jgi:hypothetical protein
MLSRYSGLLGKCSALDIPKVVKYVILSTRWRSLPHSPSVKRRKVAYHYTRSPGTSKSVWIWAECTELNDKEQCKIWGFHGGDYEECSLPRYKNPARTSQETHYVSATESSQLGYVRFGVFTAVTMKNAVFLDIKPHFVLHRRHITSPLQSPAS